MARSRKLRKRTRVQRTTPGEVASQKTRVRWYHCSLAALGIVVAVGVVLASPYRVTWPDEWAYLYAVRNFSRGDWVVDDVQHARQAQEVRAQGGILAQYVPVAENRWALEKTPGYPLLAVPLQWLDKADLTNGALAVVSAALIYLCLGHVFTWREAWMGVWLYLFTPTNLAMLYYRYMADFASGALLALGGAFYFWWLAAKERRWILLAAGLCLGWSVVVRPSNLVVAALLSLHLGWVLVRQVSKNPKAAISTSFFFGLGAVSAAMIWLSYNNHVFGTPFDYGYLHSPYEPTLIQGNLLQGTPAERAMAWRVVAGNLAGLPRPLLLGFPLLLLAVPAPIIVWRQKRKELALLATAWTMVIFLSYVPFEWLTRLLRMPHNSSFQFYVIDRYFLPWLFPLALLAMITLRRWPRHWATAVTVGYGLLGIGVYLWALKGS